MSNPKMSNHVMSYGKKYWRCTKRSCPVKTEGSEVLQQTNGDNHAENSNEAEVKRLKSSVQNQARGEITAIPSIYNDAFVGLASDMGENREVASKLPTFPSLKSSLYRARHTNCLIANKLLFCTQLSTFRHSGIRYFRIRHSGTFSIQACVST